ncbi:hypothetical protein Taro_048712 [Colocasia esculenta]|uniref:Uncharacterized protein n=1 Tax=Colocasia esculenta TaxID=4460 RepID=A0A843X8W8_COLES|nr:hypothetical protein [Colocasia esculenta]
MERQLYLLSVAARLRVCSVLGEFPTEPVTSEAHPYPHRNLKWLIEEIGVVAEMIRRKVHSV